MIQQRWLRPTDVVNNAQTSYHYRRHAWAIVTASSGESRAGLRLLLSVPGDGGTMGALHLLCLHCDRALRANGPRLICDRCDVAYKTGVPRASIFVNVVGGNILTETALVEFFTVAHPVLDQVLWLESLRTHSWNLRPPCPSSMSADEAAEAALPLWQRGIDA